MLSDLPADTLDRVASYLSSKQRARLAGTCKELWALTTCRRNWWQSVKLRPGGDHECKILVKWLEQRRNLVSRLVLDTSTCSEGSAVALLQALAGGALADLTWNVGTSNATFGRQLALFSQPPALAGVTSPRASLHLCQEFQQLSALTHLSISSDATLRTYYACLPLSLRSLDISLGNHAVCTSPLIPALAGAAAAVTALSSLCVAIGELTPMAEIYEQDLTFETACLQQPWAQKLTQLRLSVPDSVVELAPLAALTNLEILDLQLDEVDDERDSEDNSEHPLAPLSQLRTLRFGGCTRSLWVDYAPLLPLTSFPHLKVLDLTRLTMGMEDEEVEEDSVDWLAGCRARHLTFSLFLAYHHMPEGLHLPTVTRLSIDARVAALDSIRLCQIYMSLSSVALQFPNLLVLEWLLPSPIYVQPPWLWLDLLQALFKGRPSHIELLVRVEGQLLFHVPVCGCPEPYLCSRHHQIP